MKLTDTRSALGRAEAMTLVEIMVAVATGSLVLTSTIVIFVYSLFSFAGMGNYAILTGQSRQSLDKMSRELREATEIVALVPNTSLTVTNAYDGFKITYSWDETTGLLTRQLNDEEPTVFLSGCDAWEFSLYQRTPTKGWNFYTTPDLSLCKLINMRWKCSRMILGQKINTENVVTAQIVLRNKP